MARMPTRKHRLEILLTDEDREVLDGVRLDRQSAWRKGGATYVPLRVTLNQWVRQLALERVAQLVDESRSAPTKTGRGASKGRSSRKPR